MSDARNAIFAKIKAADAKRGNASPATAKARLETPPPQLVPAMGKPAATDARDLFITKAIELGCTVADCPSFEDVPAKVTAYLTEQDSPLQVMLPMDEDLSSLNWLQAGLTVSAETSRQVLDGNTSVTRAIAGVAETGAVAVTSGAKYPVSLGLLPDRHIFVLKVDEITGGYEDVWRLARDAKDNQGVARAVNLIGGPSRTGDIEATLVMGAHGPRTVHIILIGPAS